jgi:hypothetical protein
MDPFTALGVAAAVMRFVNFSAEVLSTSHELFNSNTGTTRKVSDMRAMVSILDTLNDGTKNSLGVGRGGPTVSTIERDLANLCE